jgi:gentisate 1,2-dioxygenase
MSHQSGAREMKLEDLDRELAAKNLGGFWSGNITGFEENIDPKSTVLPYLWKWSDIYDGLMKALDVVSLEMSERRTVDLVNPGLPETGFATPTIHISVQVVRPGEVAKAHRHENPSKEEAVLFSITDRPMKEALGFYFEQGRPE